MPLALLAIAALMIITGLKGNYSAVGNAFNTDVMGANGQGGFLSFMLGIVGIAVFFRIIGMPNAGKVFLVLVILVFIMENQNVLTAVQSAITGGTTAATPTAGTTSTGSATTANALPGTSGNATPLTTPAPGTGSGGIGSA
jgi:hypothetical protein